MKGYYLIIDTDGDFGLIVDSITFYQEEIRCYAENFEKLKALVNSMSVFETNPGKTHYGTELVQKLRESINNGIEANHYGGNNSFEYGIENDDCFDIVK